jgi:hypothetical protein
MVHRVPLRGRVPLRARLMPAVGLVDRVPLREDVPWGPRLVSAVRLVDGVPLRERVPLRARLVPAVGMALAGMPEAPVGHVLLRQAVGRVALRTPLRHDVLGRLVLTGVLSRDEGLPLLVLGRLHLLRLLGRPQAPLVLSRLRDETGTVGLRTPHPGVLLGEQPTLLPAEAAARVVAPRARVSAHPGLLEQAALLSAEAAARVVARHSAPGESPPAARVVARHSAPGESPPAARMPPAADMPAPARMAAARVVLCQERGRGRDGQNRGERRCACLPAQAEGEQGSHGGFLLGVLLRWRAGGRMPGRRPAGIHPSIGTRLPWHFKTLVA